jgi:hypothetical protein
MASQVSHIIYAQEYLSKMPVNGIKDKDQFILGCIFPDIRRIDETIKRKDTHLRFDPINLDFEGLTDFEAGWKFHLFCDMRREEILNKYGFYQLPDTSDLANLPAKMFEDELIYDSYNNWEKVVHLLNNVPEINNGINVPQETLALWYAIVAKYLEKKPTNKTWRIFFAKQDSLLNKADSIIGIVDKLRQNDRVIELLMKVKEEII